MTMLPPLGVAVRIEDVILGKCSISTKSAWPPQHFSYDVEPAPV